MAEVVSIETGRTRLHDQMLQLLYKCLTSEQVIAAAMTHGLDYGPVDPSDIKMAGLMVKETMMARAKKGHGLTEFDTANLLSSFVASKPIRRAIIQSLMDPAIPVRVAARSIRNMAREIKTVLLNQELANQGILH